MTVSLKDTSLKVLSRAGGLRFEGEMTIANDLPWNADIYLKGMLLDNFLIRKGSINNNQDSGKTSIITTGHIKADGRGTDLGKLSLIARLSSITLNIFDYKIKNDEDAVIILKERELSVHSLRFKGPEGSSIEIGGDLRLNDFYNLYLYGKTDLGLLRPFIPQIESLNGDGEFMVALSDRWHDPRIQGMINLKMVQLRSGIYPRGSEGYQVSSHLRRTGLYSILFREKSEGEELISQALQFLRDSHSGISIFRGRPRGQIQIFRGSYNNL